MEEKKPSSLPPGKKWLFRIAAMSGAAAAPILVLEIVLRLTWAAPYLPAPLGALRNDPNIGVVFVPNYQGALRTPSHQTHYRINSQGLRDVERAYQKPPGDYRILALGDSFVEGHGLEFAQSFLSVAQARMAPPDPSLRVDFIKAGVGGWGPVNELRYLRAEGDKYNPDHLLVVFYIGNDFAEALRPDDLVVWRGVRLRRADYESRSAILAAKIFLRKRVYCYGPAIEILNGLGHSAEKANSEDLNFLRFSAADHIAGEQEVNDAFREIQSWCEQAKVGLTVALFPHRLQVEEPRARRLAQQLQLPIEEMDLNRPSRAAIRILNELGIEYLDFAPHLREMSEAGLSIGIDERDSHYNAEVSARIGKRLAEEMERIIEAGGKAGGKTGDSLIGRQ